MPKRKEGNKLGIQRMNFVTIIGSVGEFDTIVEEIFRNYEFHPENSMEVTKNIEGLHQFMQTNYYNMILKKIKDVMTLMNLDEEYEKYENNHTTEEEIADLCQEITDVILLQEKKKNELLEKKKGFVEIGLQLKPLENISIPIEKFSNMQFVRFSFGKMSEDNYERYRLFIEQTQNIIYVPTAFLDGNVWGFYFSSNKHSEEADALFHSLHFELSLLPQHVKGVPKEIIKNLEKDISFINGQIEEINKIIQEKITQNKKKVLSCYNKIKCQSDIFEMRNYCVHSEKEFYLAGWMSEKDVEKFKKEYDKKPHINYIVEKPEALDASLVPPTKLKNPFIFRPFEEFVKMYGLPSYGEFDPTPIMAITYVLLFGIMFGDMGQGLLLFLFGVILAFRKSNLGKILIGCSFSSMIFGYVYGSVFGYEDIIPGFKALESSTNINITLMASIGVGAVLISIAMVINIYNGIKQKNVEKVFFHYNGISGFVFYWGVIVAIVALFGFGKSIVTPIYVAFVIILPLLLIYLKEPLAKLVEHKKDWKPKNFGEYLIENIFELFETLLSYITNTVSFMRVGAFALNHAGMMLAVFILSRMFGGSENIFVIIFGNLFVMCMEGLIVGIQVLRLEFYELFSRFFSGEGKAFIPFQFAKGKHK